MSAVIKSEIMSILKTVRNARDEAGDAMVHLDKVVRHLEFSLLKTHTVTFAIPDEEEVVQEESTKKTSTPKKRGRAPTTDVPSDSIVECVGNPYTGEPCDVPVSDRLPATSTRVKGKSPQPSCKACKKKINDHKRKNKKEEEAAAAAAAAAASVISSTPSPVRQEEEEEEAEEKKRKEQEEEDDDDDAPLAE